MASGSLSQTARDLFNVELNAEQQRAFERYSDELVAWNKSRANLTAITEPEAIETRHFLDSLSVLRVVRLQPGIKVIDVGTGAGFPGLPLKLAYPGIQLTLLEATGKKIAFLEHVVQQLRLRDVRLVNARAEEAGQDAAHRENYDLVLARSVAHMPILAEYMLPLCKVGGKCIAMKGESAASEMAAAENALRLLGGRLGQLVAVELPGVAETHHLAVIQKIAATPSYYPRRPGHPTKKPL